MALFIFHCGGNINSGSLRSFIFNLIFYFPLRHLFLFWAINLCSFPFASAQNKWRYIFLLFLAAANNRKRKIMPLKILNIGAVFYFGPFLCFVFLVSFRLGQNKIIGAHLLSL